MYKIQPLAKNIQKSNSKRCIINKKRDENAKHMYTRR